MSVEPFEITVSESTLDDLRDRLSRTRWPDQLPDVGWDYGTDRSYLEALVGYWRDDFDWRTREVELGQFDHFRADIDGFGIHYLYERGAGDDPMLLLLLHGWPSTFVRMLDIVPLLTDPQRYGGDPTDSFDVVVPSLPGYGFSDRPTERGMSVARTAALFERLMTDELGYERYAARGSDLGAGVIQQLAREYPDSLIGIHVSGTNPSLRDVPDDLTDAEREFVENAQQWSQTEMAYAMEQSSKPQTLAYGLNDSPAGLAAWIVEKFRAWSDCDGDLESRFGKDELLTNLTIYWATETINSSIRMYYESARGAGSQAQIDVPTAMLMSSKDMFPTPREWAERTYRIDRWTETSRGGHSLEWEEPELVADDVRAFFRSL